MTHIERLTRGRIALLLDQPFFGSLLMRLKPIISTKYPTMCTDGRSLWVNPNYMDKLSDGELRTILAHEVAHCALIHPFRMGNRIHRRFNEAADYAINNFLESFNRAAVAKQLVPPFPWPRQKNGEPNVLLDPQYDGMSAEAIYDALPQPSPQTKPQPGQGTGSGSDGGNGSGDIDPSTTGEVIAAAVDEATSEAEQAQWKVAVKQAAAVAKGQGMLPAEMERIIHEFTDPVVHWREVLRNLLTSASKDDYTWARPNVRYSGTGLILPSLYVPRMGAIVVAIDTSGSIGEQELAAFMAEVRGILFDVRPEKLITVQCDCAITEWLEHELGEDVTITLKGGGGTDFRPVFDRIAEDAEPPAALVYLTDLEGRFPDDPPPYPVIWACNNSSEAPFGHTVHI